MVEPWTSNPKVVGSDPYLPKFLCSSIFLKTILGEEALITIGLYIVDSTEIMKGPPTKKLSYSEILNCPVNS